MRKTKGSLGTKLQRSSLVKDLIKAPPRQKQLKGGVSLPRCLTELLLLHRSISPTTFPAGSSASSALRLMWLFPAEVRLFLYCCRSPGARSEQDTESKRSDTGQNALEDLSTSCGSCCIFKSLDGSCVRRIGNRAPAM
ncbi:hypothetical protein MHYP_G00024540 [Metynnis hypsauchen]